MSETSAGTALCILEIDGIARALQAQDCMLKHAAVRIVRCSAVTGAKGIVVVCGDVAAVESAFQHVLATVGTGVIDTTHLPHPHPSVLAAASGTARFDELAHTGPKPEGQSLAVVEFLGVAATLRALDAALKGAAVTLRLVHLARGFGGKGFFTLGGDLADLQAACQSAAEAAGEHLLHFELLANPHAELDESALVHSLVAL